MAEDPLSPPLIEQIGNELAEGRFEVPLLSHVAAEVMSSSLDDKADAQKLSDLIEQDASLSSHILRVVNSPAFRGASEIIALRQAIARLGLARIREIALTVSLRGTLHKPGPYEDVVTQAWQNGLSAALWAKEIARAARKNVELAYLSGLLHKVGVPILVNRATELAPGLPLEDLQDVVASLAGPAGCKLVDAWHLPAVVGVCIEQAADFKAAGALTDAVAINNAAFAIAAHMAAGTLDTDAVAGLAELQHLNFYPDDIDTLIGLAEQISSTIEGMQ